jgi:hypothetical protein
LIFFSGASKKLSIEFEKAAMKVENLLASVDAEASPALVKKLGVKTYPTLLWLV